MNNLGVIVTASIAILGWTGILIWFLGQMRADIRSMRALHNEHVTKDEGYYARIQAMEVTHASFGGMLSNLELRVARAERDFMLGDTGSSKEFQLKLDNQSNELILKFRDMLHAAKKEWGDESSRAAISIFHAYMKERQQ